MKIWFVEFPTYRYKQDIKELARKNNLKIVDAKFKSEYKPEHIAEKTPTIALKPQYEKKEAAPAV